MFQDGKILIGKGSGENGAVDACLSLKMANRHGMITGATGTGKTVSLKVLAESFSDAGVPVFVADVKGDLATLAQAGGESPSVRSRLEEMGLPEEDFFRAYPVSFWDLYEKTGLPLRTTVSEMGPILLARVLGLNPLQSDILSIVFRIADDEGLLLLDTKDLKSMLAYVSENSKAYAGAYGHIAPASVAAITRAVVALEGQGADLFFGEPALDVRDFFQLDQGRGVISLLDARQLVLNPKMYSTLLLWMLSELYETLPEVGDREKPKIVFFFDEAHMLFREISPDLLEKITQVVRLCRSKGIGIFFVTQNPADLPDEIIGQLGAKIQHALHAYTPKEIKAVKAAAGAYRANPAFDTEEAILNLGIGEALISVLQEDGVPSMVEKCRVLPPESALGTADETGRDLCIRQSLLYPKYAEAVDRESAYELLEQQAIERAEAAERKKAEELAAKEEAKAQAMAEKQEAREKAAREKAEAAEERRRKAQVTRIASSAAGTVGREIGNTIGKTVGGSFGKRIGGNVGAQLGRSILGTLFK